MSYKNAEKRFDQLKDFLRKKLGFPIQEKEVHDEETKKRFNLLTPKEKLEFIKPQLEFFTNAVARKTEMLPTLATLAAALVVVATLNPSLVPLSTTDTKIILSIFLILIPCTLHYYIKLMEKTAANAVGIIASYQGKDPFRNIEKIFIAQFGADFPILTVYIFYGVILFVLFKMW